MIDDAVGGDGEAGPGRARSHFGGIPMRKQKTGYFAGALLLTIAASAPSPASASYRVIGTRGGFLEAEAAPSPSLLDSLVDWLIGDTGE
jgi:hypothetical protein